MNKSYLYFHKLCIYKYNMYTNYKVHVGKTKYLSCPGEETFVIITLINLHII